MEQESVTLTKENLVSDIRRKYSILLAGIGIFVPFIITAAVVINAAGDSGSPTSLGVFIVVTVGVCMLIILWMVKSDLGKTMRRLLDHSLNPEESPEDN